MARSNLLDTKTVDFGELLGNGKIYRVPAYQRDYSWTEEHWEDLWADILALDSEGTHYMGSLVVAELREREFEIIDGQQRAATLSILALTIIKSLEDLALSSQDPERNRERAAALRRVFIGEKDPASLLESSKLVLNETDNPFYQDYLVQLRTPANVRRLPRSNKLLWDCYQYFLRRVKELPISGDGEALARLLNETVSRRLLFILITVEDEMNAYTVFETLNARGEELTTTDLLKNYLFSRVHVPADLQALQRRWARIVDTVTATRFPAFLRYHLQTTEARVRSPRVFKMVRERTRTPEEVFALIDALETRAELFAALSDPDHGFWLDRPETKPHIRELVLFNTQQMTPLLFVAFERLSPARFQGVLRMVTVLLFRYTVVSDQNTNALEPAFHAAAKAVSTGTASTAVDVANVLQSVYIGDEKFQQDFSGFTIQTTGQKKKLAKYVLARLEHDASGRHIDPDTDPATIAHILPENPGPEWDTAFTTDEQDRLVYRVGNLSLLEASLNREAGSKSYNEKLPFFGASQYQLTASIPAIAPVEWTPALIAERQSRLAARATHVWRVDF